MTRAARRPSLRPVDLPYDVATIITKMHATAFLEDRARQLLEHYDLRAPPASRPGFREVPVSYAILVDRAGYAQARSLRKVFVTPTQDPWYYYDREFYLRRFYSNAEWDEVAVARPARYTVLLVRASYIKERWLPVRAYSVHIPGGRIATVRDRLDTMVSWVLRKGCVQGPHRAPLEQPLLFKQWRTDDVIFV